RGGPACGVVEEQLAAGHAGPEVAPDRPQDDHRPAGHVLAAVVADALDDRGGARGEDRQPPPRAAPPPGAPPPAPGTLPPPPVMYSPPWSPPPSTTAVAPELRTANRSPARPAQNSSPRGAPYRAVLPIRTGSPASSAGGRITMRPPPMPLPT